MPEGSDKFKRFKDIVNNNPDMEMFAGRGKKMVNIETTDLKELYDNVNKWGDMSFQGLVCGIYGCQEDPTMKCPICGGCYCIEDIKKHFHVKGHDGIIVREIKEQC